MDKDIHYLIKQQRAEDEHEHKKNMQELEDRHKEIMSVYDRLLAELEKGNE